MGKKIGILTFHNAINYGAILQALALQQFIESNTASNAEIIDLTTEDHIKGLSPFVLRSSNPVKNVLLKIWNLRFLGDLKRRNNRFQNFKREMLHISENRFCDANDIAANSKVYDILITGSDQVFHPKIKNTDAYYLNFDTKGAKKVAYAPSFGVSEISSDESIKIAGYLNSFDCLSCREQQGSHLMTKLTDKAIPTVCDPVFLLDSGFWMELADKAQINQTFDYIFMFDLNGGDNLAKIARSVSKKTGFSVVCASFNILNRHTGFHTLYDLGPLEWLSWMKNARYIVTDSFHGSAIGLKMGKRVLTYVAAPSLSSRLNTLYDKLGISNQLIYNLDTFDLSKIDFKNYNDKLEEFISSSKTYLLDAITR